MLETVDPDKKIDKESYRLWFPRLKADLLELQQRMREARLPVIILFEGWSMSGKADAIKHIGEALDPRGFMVHTTDHPSEDERERHWLWRFWVRMPPRGKTAMFEGSWYSRVLDERVEGTCRKKDWASAFLEINQTEEMLTASGVLLIKFWLHLSRKEQRKRIKASEDDPLRRIRVGEDDWRQHHLYDDYRKAAEDMIERTDTAAAPWTIVEADDHRFRRMKIFQSLCDQIAARLNQPQPEAAPKARVSVPALEEMPTVLDSVNLTRTIPPAKYEDLKVVLQLRLRKCQLRAIEAGLTPVIVYEGWDASGKGGSIRRLTATLDPRFYDVIPIGKPSREEFERHYLWRFWSQLPRWGHMRIFDRSWYGRVLVERIENLCSGADWRRAYSEINDFELQLYRSGITLVKFWLHISPEEQLRRFEARKADPHRHHKLTDEDWRNRLKWDQYREAVDEMIHRTSTPYAPWTIVEGDCKRFARVKTMETVCEALEQALKQREN